MTVALGLSLAIAWYVLRGLARRWAWARRCVRVLSPWTARLHAWVLSAPVTFTYIAIFTASTVVQRTSPPRLIDLLTKLNSTNLLRLGDDPLEALLTSAFWVADHGSGLATYMVVFGTIVAWAERRYGSPRMLLIGASGHVFGSLLTAAVEKGAIEAGRLPHKIAFATDVGVSYVEVGSCAAAVLIMSGWVRLAGTAVMFVSVGLPVIVDHTIWDLGHLFATLCGLTAAVLLRAVGPLRAPPPLRTPLVVSTAGDPVDL
ncbi:MULTISPECIES: rhomboid-like protein [unclassified Embleya]|uniref:rhomboid-like protein n=1 Tax=unclassified Embleya TaxID=2699296 RepID=UPI00340B3674